MYKYYLYFYFSWDLLILFVLYCSDVCFCFLLLILSFYYCFLENCSLIKNGKKIEGRGSEEELERVEGRETKE